MADLDLDRIARHRTELGALATELTALGAELAARQAELADASRDRPGRPRARRAERRVAELETPTSRPRTSGGPTVGARRRRRERARRTRSTPSRRRVARRQGPVALLPVRIETRFAEAGTALHIRIFPDQVHLDAHEPAFTDDERAGGEWYWNERWPALDDAARAERAWPTLAGRFRPGRARYLLETLRPANLDRAPDEPPAFPDDRHAGQLVDPGGRGHRAARALGGDRLPGLLGGVPGVVGPGARSPGRRPLPGRRSTRPPPPDADARTPLVQDAFRWAVDPDAARDAGMLLTVRDSDLAFGRPLADGLTRLVVLGVDWTLTPEQAAAALEALLAGHAATGDLAFVAPGTPTNNTGSNRSGLLHRALGAGGRMGAAGRGGRPRHRGRRRRRPARRRAGRRRGAARRRAGRRRPPPRARLGAARRPVGGDRRLLRVRAARPPRQRRRRRRHPGARRRHALRLRPAAADPGRPAALRRAARRAPAARAAPGLGAST